MTLLIAEDNLRVRTMLKDIAGAYFTEIYECGDGKKACELYEEHKPDWTFMDIEMPVMDGISATRKITESNQDAKIIIVTGFDSNALRRNAKEAGAVNYILKEDSNDIKDIIKKIAVIFLLGTTTFL